MYKPASNNANAAATYDNSAKNTTDDQRTLEARALLKSNRQLKALQESLASDPKSVRAAQIDEVLTANRKLWTLFYDAALENDGGNRPNDLRSNIINLSNFIFKRTVDILAAPSKEKIDILITINNEVAQGLIQGAAQVPAKEQSEDKPEQSSFSGVSA